MAILIIHLLEFLAFLAGLFYYFKNKSRPTYYLVWFLGITVFFEIFGWYVVLISNGPLYFLKDTVFDSNYWSSNIYSIISYLFYINYFKWYLSSKNSIHILNRVSVVFLAVSILEILFSKGFFVKFMPISNILGTLLVFLSIAFYYLELLKSDHILQVHKSLPFYVSVGALIFHLCTTPLFLYSAYYSNSIDPGFVSLYRQVIFGTNYLLYSIYIAGFLICLRKKDPYFLKKNF
ncbi:hypothetical protein AEQU2_01609 [Aequorivita lipolytica]|nr:hypothetical protein AEQU2_01609 [Aequorivita lipolytica]